MQAKLASYAKGKWQKNYIDSLNLTMAKDPKGVELIPIVYTQLPQVPSGYRGLSVVSRMLKDRIIPMQFPIIQSLRAEGFKYYVLFGTIFQLTLFEDVLDRISPQVE